MRWGKSVASRIFFSYLFGMRLVSSLVYLMSVSETYFKILDQMDQLERSRITYHVTWSTPTHSDAVFALI